MLRTHTCGELNNKNIGEVAILCGWVQKSRDLGGMTFIDLRDRYGITQLAFNMDVNADLCSKARTLGREFVLKIEGKIIERESKNKQIPTGEIEIDVTNLIILNESKTPPFTIENESDGGEELRMQYRYLDIRRKPVRDSLMLRSKVSLAVRKYLDAKGFAEVETPYLIKSTPEGARDFVVPSRMNQGEFYALPQSPQTFKQLLMVAGMDKYYQIVKCFRDEDLRADRQPEFTQIDCEMSFVERDDILETFEGLVRSIFKETRGIDLPVFPRITYDEAMEKYGCDKPDTRFGMEFVNLNSETKGKGFAIFDDAELVLAINVKGAANYSRKELDKLTDFVRRPQIGAKGLIYARINEDGSLKSSVDKFYNQDDLQKWATATNAERGDLILVLSGKTDTVRKQMSELRLEMGSRLGLRNPAVFSPLWVVDFPLLEWDEDSKRYHAMHHPFTAPLAGSNLNNKNEIGNIKANAYDMVINGVELGGGSIRIYDKEMQETMFDLLGFSKEEAQQQFGFLMKAFEYGAPPHGGIAFGLDRLVSMIGGSDSIRDYIAFPKNNSGRDTMINSPSPISEGQLKELCLETTQ